MSELPSLKDRMKARARELASRRTKIFPIPGYGDLIAVELMAISWEDMRKVQDRHSRMADSGTRDLYIAADELAISTVALHEVDAEQFLPSEESWLTLAQGVVEGFPQDGTVRQAILALIQPSSRVIVFYNDYMEWAAGERTEISVELDQDFASTR